ncbi:hypothetical protein EDC01DRAFT_679178 [Geopyxis carbonaria]|nr:hypothetical protein EDC01DRAFT_679178 [Geopyxis carbonaria]
MPLTTLPSPLLANILTLLPPLSIPAAVFATRAFYTALQLHLGTVTRSLPRELQTLLATPSFYTSQSTSTCPASPLLLALTHTHCALHTLYAQAAPLSIHTQDPPTSTEVTRFCSAWWTLHTYAARCDTAVLTALAMPELHCVYELATWVWMFAPEAYRDLLPGRSQRMEEVVAAWRKHGKSNVTVPNDAPLGIWGVWDCWQEYYLDWDKL